MDIGKERRVIEVAEPTVEPVEITPLEVEEPAKSGRAEPRHTRG